MKKRFLGGPQPTLLKNLQDGVAADQDGRARARVGVGEEKAGMHCQAC